MRLEADGDSSGWNGSQLNELDCDAFAFLVLARALGKANPWNKPDWYAAIFGALVALPALEDAAMFGGIEGDTQHVVGETHPPMASRFAQLADFIVAFPMAEQEADHPVGLLAQLLFYAEVLEAARA